MGANELNAFCSRAAVGITLGIPLVVASLDLQLVRRLRSAMAGGNAACGTCHPGPRLEPRPAIKPTAEIEPRLRHEPTSRIEPRKVLHAEAEPAVVPPPPPLEPERSGFGPLPIQPPWKVLPWQQTPSPAPILKIILHPPDLGNKGTVLDVFI